MLALERIPHVCFLVTVDHMNRPLALLLSALLMAGWIGCARNRPALQSNFPVPDVFGKSVQPLASATNRAVVLVFLANECPISNRAIPELRRLHKTFAARGIAFWFVHPNADETDVSVRQHATEYELPGTPLRDPGLKLARAVGAQVTPTAVVISPRGEVLYRGRIDDRYTALGQSRPEPTTHDLEHALESVLAGRVPAPAQTRAVGCHLVGAL